MSPQSFNFSCLSLPLVYLLTAGPFNSNAYALQANRSYTNSLLQAGYQMCILRNVIRPTGMGHCHGPRLAANCYRQFRPHGNCVFSMTFAHRKLYEKWTRSNGCWEALVQTNIRKFTRYKWWLATFILS